MHGNDLSGWIYAFFVTLIADSVLPFLHFLNEYAQAVVALLAITTFIINQIDRIKKS